MEVFEYRLSKIQNIITQFMASRKPNLFLIGASKCGTTSVWNMLNEHPDIFMCKPKEPNFFSFSDYEKNMSKYLSLFKNSKKEIILGEASTIYSETTIIPQIAERLYKFNSEAKIIYIIRNPFTRIKSAWIQTRSSGHHLTNKYSRSTDSKVGKMPNALKKAIISYPPFIESSRYKTHIENYLKFFEEKNLLVLFYEDLENNPVKFINEIFQFLNVKMTKEINFNTRSNIGKNRTEDYSVIFKLKKSRLAKTFFKVLKKIFGQKIKVPRKMVNTNFKISMDIEEIIKKELKPDVDYVLISFNKNKEYWPEFK